MMKLKRYFESIFVLIIFISIFGCSSPDLFPSEPKQELSTEYDYSYEYSLDELEVIKIDCEVCDDITECRYMCLKGCAEENMFFEGFSPLFGRPEINGNCPCTCRSLAHVNEKMLNDALLKEDPKICGEIVYPTELYTKDYCHLILAMVIEDELICENIEKQSYDNSKDVCYSMLALTKKDINLCSNVVDEDDPYTSKSICKETFNGGYPPYISVPR